MEMESDREMFSGKEDNSKHCSDNNPWLHLQTITSFDTANKTGKDLVDSITHLENYVKSQKVHHSSGAAGSVNTHIKKVDQKGFSLSSKEVHPVEKPFSSVEERVSRSSNNRVSKYKVNRKKLSSHISYRSRTRKISLSEGDIQSIGPCSVYTRNSSNSPKSGALSETGGDSMLKKVANCSQDPVEALSRFSPTSLLVESLIDQLCKLMEKDTTRQKTLYNVICDRLHRMHLIDDTYTIEEFQFMRSHYQRALYQLLAVAKSSTSAPDERSIILPLPSSNINVDLKFHAEQVLEWSRYHHEYQELEYIAKGGFGRVYRVRNKLDGGEYAIKKIFLRYCYIEGFLRSLKEVKMLARLNHPNIVSYKAAWLEPLEGKPHTQTERSTHSPTNVDASVSIYSYSYRLPLPPSSQVARSDSSDIVFQDTSPDTDTPTSNNGDKKTELNGMEESLGNCMKQGKEFRSRKLLSEFLDTHSVQDRSFRSESSSSDLSGSSSDAAIFALSRSKDKSNHSVKAKGAPVALRNWATLYVQMQLCQRTLRQWLDERNLSLPAYPLGSASQEGFLALLLFRKIVRGVEYIHSQGIVHHDIKPSNIFVSENLKEVQVGDFGLSCCLLSRVDHTGTVGDYHGGVGTKMYAAPEQLRGKCTPKSDIYSLGIVLLELLQPFHTDMERSKVIEKLRVGHLPSELSATWPHAARLMSDMLVISFTARPTACELLKRVEMLVKMNSEGDVSSLLATKDETIRLLKEAVASRDQEIAKLRHRLSHFESDKSNISQE